MHNGYFYASWMDQDDVSLAWSSVFFRSRVFSFCEYQTSWIPVSATSMKLKAFKETGVIE